MESPTRELERLNSKHEKRAGSTLQIQDPKATPLIRFSWRALDEYCTARRSVISLFSIFAFLALVGCFAYTNSMGGYLSHDGFVVSYNGREQSMLRHREPLGFASSAASEAIRDQQKGKRTTAAGAAPYGCNAKDAPLRVFMYDLPPEFHYGMLSNNFSKGQIWPRNVTGIPAYPGGLYQQHSPEYWITSDLLTSTMPDRRGDCTAYRVSDWRDADVIFVPFFASLSYNKYTKAPTPRGNTDRSLQERLVKYLTKQPAWQASGGVDHVVVIHHPNSMHAMRQELRSVMYVVADFGRYALGVANLGKDVVAPYKHVVADFDDKGDTTSFASRETLLYFQGAIKRKETSEDGQNPQPQWSRGQLYQLLHSERDVHFSAGNTTSGAIHSATAGMRGTKFCLNLAGDTPSSNRLFDSIAGHCVPVIISDDIELPFEDVLDYSQFCLFVKFQDALQRGFLMNLLRGVSAEQWTRMWMRLQQVDRHFVYQHPAQPQDAVHMIWMAILRMLPTMKLFLNRRKRYSPSRKELKASVIPSFYFHW